MLSTHSAHYDVLPQIVDYVKDALGTKPSPITDFERQEALNKWSKAKITKVQDIVAKEKNN